MVSVIFRVTLLLVGLSSPAWAATYYTATTGSDGASGAEDAPFLTIQKCVDMMVAGDTCYIRGGTYNASGVRMQVSGTQASPIKLIAYPNETPILSCTASSAESNSITIRNNAGLTTPMGWITIDGLTIQNCNDGIKGENIHNSTFTHLRLKDNDNQGILITGAHDNTLSYSIISHSGDFLNCVSCTQQHGVYLSGKRWTIHHNVFYDNLAYGIQMNGSSSANNAATVPDPAFRGAQDWVISDNTLAYQSRRAGIVVWGSTTTNFRIENNIFYENAVVQSSSVAQGVDFVSATGVTGGSIRNNHFYASGSGGQAYLGTAPPSSYTNSGNVVNVSAPAFVDGGSNSLPASPDFRLTASAPVNIARVNEFPNNGTLVVGPYKTVGTPTAGLTVNKITLTLPMNTAVPVQNLSTTGVSISCTANVCPGTPAVSSVSRSVGTDSQVEILLSGITSNACLSHADAVTVSLASGTWTTNDNIGPYPGTHQSIFNFTNVPVMNQCTGSGPTGYPAGYHLYYKFDEGTGTNANDESVNNLDCTLTNSPSWGTGKSGTGLTVAAGSTQNCAIPWGSGVNPSTQSLTVFVPVYISTGATSAQHYVAGPSLGTNQRAYICGKDGTWRISIQTVSCSGSSASNLAITEGWNVLTLVFNATTDVATLYKDTTTGTGGATLPYTSFTFSSNWKLGQVDTLTSTGATYDEFLIYLSVQDPADLVAGFNTPPVASGDTFSQAAIQFQGVILDTAGSPIVIGPSVQSIEVPAGGGAVILFQVHCTNVADCALTAFKLVYAKNGSAIWQQVPDIETADGTWMWGVTTDAHLNNGTRSTRLTGSCTVTTGTTQVTSAQTPSIDLPQDGCVVLGYIVRAGSIQAGNYFDYKLQTEAGLDFATYTQTAQIRVVNPMASGIGF